MVMRVILTGGLGFIGSHFVKHFLKSTSDKDLKLYNIDYAGYGSNPLNIENEVKEDPRYEFIKKDINHIFAITDIEGADIIVNIAAESHVDRSIIDPRTFISSNIQGTFSLLEYARKKDVKKFIQVSTDEVYGDAPAEKSFKESDPINPSNPYSATKAAADVLVKSYHRTYGINAVISRCTNNYGPNQFPEKFIPRTIIRILKGKPVILYGNGKAVRDWIHVSDHITALLSIMNKGLAGEVYNISSDNPTSNAKVSNYIAKFLKPRDSKKIEVNYVNDRPGHDLRYSIQSTKIREELGWSPKIRFEEGLDETIRWYVQHVDWWAPLTETAILHPPTWEF